MLTVYRLQCHGGVCKQKFHTRSLWLQQLTSSIFRCSLIAFALVYLIFFCISVTTNHCEQNRRDGVVVRASASQSVDLGFIPLVESYQKTLKNVIHSFPAWRSAHRDSVENKPASLLVVSLGRALNGMPPSLCGRQMVGPSSLPVVVAQSDERHANRA